MSITSAYLSVGGVEVDVVYKEIKNLHIGVYPPVGRVRVSAPKQLNDEQVRLAIANRLPWIRRQREQLKNAERQTAREMVTGESHFVWGSRRRLKVIERPGPSHVEVNGDRLLLSVAEGTSTDKRREVLDRWYRKQLREAIPPIIEKWERKLRLDVPKWSIRRMKTKWGSCNRETGQVWFNLELAKKHPDCLEYLAVHEMMHLIERGHGERFIKLMVENLPDWRRRRDDLNDAPLVAEVWDV